MTNRVAQLRLLRSKRSSNFNLIRRHLSAKVIVQQLQLHNMFERRLPSDARVSHVFISIVIAIGWIYQFPAARLRDSRDDASSASLNT